MTLLVFPAPALDAVTPPVDIDTIPEERVSALFTDYVEAGSSGLGYFVRRPAPTVGLLRDLRRLPVLDAHPTSGPAGAALRSALPRTIGPDRLFGHRLVLELPEYAEDYLAGRSKQMLRRKAREAQRQGVSWRLVESAADRRRLLVAAANWERHTGAGSDLADLADHDLWLAAYGPDGRPLLLTVIPVDGDWAVLRYHRTIGVGALQGNARYLMMQVVADQLIARGVRHLVDAVSPASLRNGPRHFQRMLGFRIFRVRVH